MKRVGVLCTEMGSNAKFWKSVAEQFDRAPMREWSWETWDNFFALAEQRGMLCSHGNNPFAGLFTRSLYFLRQFMLRQRAQGFTAAVAIAAWDEHCDSVRKPLQDSVERYDRARAASISANASARKPVAGGSL